MPFMARPRALILRHAIRPIAVILAAVSAAGFWLAAASALWSKGTGTPFTPFAWWDATQWWLANWWVNLWLVLAAAAPTIFLAMLLFGLFQVWRLRWRATSRNRRSQRHGGGRCNFATFSAGSRPSREFWPRPSRCAQLRRRARRVIRRPLRWPPERRCGSRTPTGSCAHEWRARRHPPLLGRPPRSRRTS